MIRSNARGRCAFDGDVTFLKHIWIEGAIESEIRVTLVNKENRLS